MKTERILAFLLMGSTLSIAQERPQRVDLRQWQTPVRNQGSQGSCFIHANVAAMEAAYKRQGYGDLNLAEEFSYYMGPLLWLKTKAYSTEGYRTAQLRVPPLPERECGLPFFDFAPESGHLDSNRGSFPVLNLPIPTENDFPRMRAVTKCPFRRKTRGGTASASSTTTSSSRAGSRGPASPRRSTIRSGNHLSAARGRDESGGDRGGAGAGNRGGVGFQDAGHFLGAGLARRGAEE